ncbi:MAG TPA: hypothetical protein VHH57_01100 [Gaiella sp.]|nr:hypothetical protein [Gaiella sp.]
MSPTQATPKATVRPAKKAAPKPKPAEQKRAEAPPVVRVPRDAVRLGLPLATLAPRRPGDDVPVGPLVAAALLLGAAAGGSLLVGVAARSATRQA